MENIIIVQSHNDGFAFAVTESRLEHIYIPSYAREGVENLEPGKTYKAALVPNYSVEQRDRTPWVCVKIEADTPAPVVPVKTAEQAATEIIARDEVVFNAIKDGGYMTSAELEMHSGMDMKTAVNSANRLHAAGRVAKADVYGKAGQSRASFTLWALNTRKFIE